MSFYIIANKNRVYGIIEKFFDFFASDGSWRPGIFEAVNLRRLGVTEQLA